MSKRLDARAIARLTDDLSRADLGDPRRNARAQQVVRRLAAMPNASLPDAMVTDAELEGAYRLFSNEEVTFERLMEAQAAATFERAQRAGVILAVHDTTQCLFKHADPEEVGYLNTGKAGFRLHMALLLDTRVWRRPLGVGYAEILAREARPRRRGTKHRRSSFASARDQDKEFARWWRGVEALECRATANGDELVHVADRESDSYDLMAQLVSAGHRFVFRGRHNRVLEGEHGRIRLDEALEHADVMLERDVPLSRRLAEQAPRSRRTHPPRESRTAKLVFSRMTAKLRRPNCAVRSLPATISVNVLRVQERDAPAGQEPVEWLLYTTERVETREDLERVVDYYRARWVIEELNKALKTGCVVQDRQLESFDALTTMLALSLPVAVELLALRTLAQMDTLAPASHILDKQQLAALRHLSHRPLPENPTVQDALWCIAGLGGHIKNNGWPGWQVLQRGMEKFVAFAAGWRAREAADL